MNEIQALQAIVSKFSGMAEDEFYLSKGMWHLKTYGKNDFYNEHRSVCKYLGFIIDGSFRSYVVDPKTNEEKNVFLFSSNGFISAYKSFITQMPCDYHTQAITDAKVLCIGIGDLMDLYRQSHKWESFGRLVAQEAFSETLSRVEGFIFKSPEERYVELIKKQPDIHNTVPLYHISSYLGIQGPSLSRIRKRISGK